MPLDVVHGLLVTGDSYGICLTEEKGQRAFNKSYIDPPNPNHLIYSRESGTTGFLVIEGERTDHVAPAPVSDPKAEAGDEAGDIVLSWTCTADDTREGAKALGYRVYLSTEELTTERLNDKTLLPRHLTYRPKEPGTRQVFPIHNLQPGTPYHFAVVAYDKAGNASAPTFLKGTVRPSRTFVLQPHKKDIGGGHPWFLRSAVDLGVPLE